MSKKNMMCEAIENANGLNRFLVLSGFLLSAIPTMLKYVFYVPFFYLKTILLGLKHVIVVSYYILIKDNEKAITLIAEYGKK